MKTSHLAALVAFLAAAGAQAAPSLDARHQGTPHEALYCIDTEGDAAVAAGAPALLFESADGGQTWAKTAQDLTTEALLGCRLRNGIGFIVGQGGVILRRDKGSAWAKVESGTTQRLFAIDGDPAGLMVAVGAFGTVIRSDDGGKTWRGLTIDWTGFNPEGLEPHLYGIAIDAAGAITVAGEFETILRSTDGGATWTAVHGGEASLFDLVVGTDGVGFAVGQKGTILRTADGGLSWSAEPAPTSANLFGLRIRRDGAVLITGMRVLVEGTKGGGWQVVTPGDVATTWYQGVAVGAGGRWLASGHQGRIVAVDP